MTTAPGSAKLAVGLAEQGVILKTVRAVLAAFAVNLLVVGTAEWGLSRAFPPPPGVNLSDPAQLEAFMNGMPLAAYLGLLLGWTLGAIGASATAYFIAERRVWAAFVGAGINLLGVLASVATLPHPLWVAAVGLIAPLMVAAAVPRFGGAAAV